MTDPEEDADQGILARIAVGDLRPDAPEVVTRRSRDPAFAAAVDELLRTMGVLDVAGAEERAWLADAKVPSASSGMRPGLVADTIGRLAASAGPAAAAGRARSRRALWICAAAAAGVAMWLLLRDPGGSRPDDRPLGSEHVSLRPARRDAGTLVLEWTTDLAGAGFAVSIWLAEDPARRPLLEHETRDTRWRIEAGDWRPLEARHQALRWRVIATRGSFTAEREDELVLPH